MGIRHKTLKMIHSKIMGTSQVRLGYPRDTKLLIIHADDLGLSNSENRASVESIETGMVNSGSIMVTCPNFNDITDYAKDHPEIDLGVHLTLTSEWPYYKWGPVLPLPEVSSLVDDNGYFFENSAELKQNYQLNEVEKELRAQIFMAINAGIDLTHIDSHMFAAFADKKLLEVYIKLGREFRLPTLLTRDIPLRYLFSKDTIVVDHLFHARPKDNNKGLADYYRNSLNSVRPGLNCLLVHMAYDDKEMQDITREQSYSGSAMRQADFDFFTSNECRQLIRRNSIQLITWREIRDKLVRCVSEVKN